MRDSIWRGWLTSYTTHDENIYATVQISGITNINCSELRFAQFSSDNRSTQSYPVLTHSLPQLLASYRIVMFTAVALITLLCICVGYVISYYRKQLPFIQVGKILPGPKTLPILGNSLQFFRKNFDGNIIIPVQNFNNFLN